MRVDQSACAVRPPPPGCPRWWRGRCSTWDSWSSPCSPSYTWAGQGGVIADITSTEHLVSRSISIEKRGSEAYFKKQILFKNFKWEGYKLRQDLVSLLSRPARLVILHSGLPAVRARNSCSGGKRDQPSEVVADSRPAGRVLH